MRRASRMFLPWMTALVLGLATEVVAAPSERSAEPSASDARSERARVLHLIRPIEAFLHAGEVDGVTLDRRDLGNPPEVLRLSLVPQLLGFCELYRAQPTAARYQDIVDRADYLTDNLAVAISGNSNDGMLAMALLEASALTGHPRYRDAAAPMLTRFRTLSGFDARLNWGLMAAMALAENYRQTGDAGSLDKARSLVAGASFEQNLDGSWPHVCYGSKDVHYTAWMTQELIQIGERIGDDERLSAALENAFAFLSQRVDSAGFTSYEASAPAGITRLFYSRATGCLRDYDTRGWNNELGYHAVLFDRFEDPRLASVLALLAARVDQGGFADKWDFLPAADDPIYPWASDAHSVIRTSVIFWSLATLVPDHRPWRHGRHLTPHVTAASEVEHAEGTTTETEARTPGASLAKWLELGPITPQPARGACAVTLRLPAEAEVELQVLDLSGRRVRDLSPGRLAAGDHRIGWDGRDGSGAESAPGIYLLRARALGAQAVARVLRLH